MINSTKHKHKLEWQFITIRMGQKCENCVKKSTAICKWLNVIRTEFEYWTQTGLLEVECSLPCGRQEWCELSNNWETLIIINQQTSFKFLNSFTISSNKIVLNVSSAKYQPFFPRLFVLISPGGWHISVSGYLSLFSRIAGIRFPHIAGPSH